jgi:hypothetical protein
MLIIAKILLLDARASRPPILKRCTAAARRAADLRRA